MKSGKTLVELATEIQNQAQAKRDYIADTRTLELTDVGIESRLQSIGIAINSTITKLLQTYPESTILAALA
ncbi:hypothetical protein [Merismopedia glauca]|uniref:Uncharacterized protein n=1 Tax=Merismopedia glauca CCAP 1448/3 TaxID=1296344 RepID=A0A2T1BWU2_9CYAN|nr:hypothetical protein [Merismopedia glauca]PSB00471.1 hypothetical protein C7B64_23355 [Merismopedia glauca CCAP 1448/3]